MKVKEEQKDTLKQEEEEWELLEEEVIELDLRGY